MHRIAIVLMGASLLSGCAAGLPGLRPLTYQEPGDTRVYVSYKACPHTAGANFAPVLAALAVEAASQLIKGFGTALSKGSEGGALPSSTATANIEVGAELPQCLIIIRGRFSPDDKHKNEVALPAIAEGTNPLKLVKRDGSILETTLPNVYDLQHYVELQIVPSQNKSALTFGPALVYVARSMDGAKSGDRSLSIAIKFDRPGHDGVGSAVLIGNRRIGDMDAYTLDERDRLRYEAPWFAAIEAPDAAPAAGAGAGAGGVVHAKAPPPGQRAGGGAAGGDGAADGGGGAGAVAPAKAPGSVNGPFPYTLTTTVIETRPTKEFLAFVASVFTGAEPALTDAVKGQIDPATRLSAHQATIDNQSAYSAAFATAQTSLLTYCALPAASSKADLITKSAAARTAQLAANKAALSADITTPFPDLVEVGTTDPATVTLCANYH